MTNLIEQLPEKWELDKLLLPANSYKYFSRRKEYEFQDAAGGHSAVNAWWLAECLCLLMSTKML